MTSSLPEQSPSDIPSQIFEQFIESLEKAGSSAELTTNLRQTLLVDKNLTETALKTVLLGEETSQ